MFDESFSSRKVISDRFTHAMLRSDHWLLFLQDGNCLLCSAVDYNTTNYLRLLTKSLADATGTPPEITVEAGKLLVRTLPTISGGWSTPSVRRVTSSKADGVWGNAASTYLKLPAVVHPARPLASLMTQDLFGGIRDRGSYWCWSVSDSSRPGTPCI